MPKEKFYDARRSESDHAPADIEVAWGNNQEAVTINGIAYDRSGIARLRRALGRASDLAYGETDGFAMLADRLKEIDQRLTAIEATV